jgi:menaquinol-cytochrome c reductase iron-sulfur subunit
MVKHMAQGLSRRSFYALVINALGTAMAAVIAAPAVAYLFIKPKTSANKDLLEIADLTAVPVGKPQEVLFTRTRVDGWKTIQEKTSTWLVKNSAGQVTAFAPTCTHLGCAYHWEADEKSFICPCHSSVFDIAGNVMSGPAPRPLDQLPVQIENGKVLVNPNSKSKEA